MYLLEEDLKFPKDSFKSMKYQPYEMKPTSKRRGEKVC